MEVTYNSRCIHTVAKLDLETDCWIPNADVSWHQSGTKAVNCSPDPLVISRLSMRPKSTHWKWQRRGLTLNPLMISLHKRSNGQQKTKGESHVQAYFNSYRWL